MKLVAVCATKGFELNSSTMFPGADFPVKINLPNLTVYFANRGFDLLAFAIPLILIALAAFG